MQTSPRPDIFSYLDFRLFLRDLVHHLRATNKFDVKTFARESGFRSASYLKMIIDGQRTLTPKAALQVSLGLKLRKPEALYLEKLSQYCQCEDVPEKARFFQELMRLKGLKNIRRLQDAEFQYYSDWRVVVLHEALQNADWQNKSIPQIASALQVSEDDAAMDLQLKVYTAAGRGEGFEVRAAYLHDLTAPKDNARHPVDASEEAVRAAIVTVESLCRGVRARDFAPSPGEHCKRCDVRRLCPHGRAT